MYSPSYCWQTVSISRLQQVSKLASKVTNSNKMVSKEKSTVLCVLGKGKGEEENMLSESNRARTTRLTAHALPSHIPRFSEGSSRVTEFEPASAMSGSRPDNEHCRQLWSSLRSNRHGVSVADTEQTEAFVTWQTKETPRALHFHGIPCLRQTLSGFLITCSSSRPQEGP